MAVFAIDLDGTLIAWGEDHRVPGPWLPGAKEALQALVLGGHEVIVHSCRVTWPPGGGLDGVVALLAKAGFAPYLVEVSPESGLHIRHAAASSAPRPALGVWVGQGKPVADLYIDDRALAFDGDWAAICKSILPDR